ncbi:MAG: aldose 1-epimerase [Flavobacteriaceae bacterium]
MMVQLRLTDHKVGIEAGELTSYEVSGHEFIHQKGSPGWRNSDTEMFPIIGPTNEARFQVQTPRTIAVLDQHGLLRELDYEPISQTATTALFKKVYKAHSRVKNAKYPEKSSQQFLFWPYDFQFEKKFELLPDGLEITFTVSGERDAPFMLGYHPAFKLETKNPVILANGKQITLDAVLEAGSRALLVADCDEIILKDGQELRITTKGFGNFMLWTEVRNMVCIEPITFYPNQVAQNRLFEGFQYLLDAPKEFKVRLDPIT